MEKNKDLHKNAGFILGGPSREQLFDSLRLDLPVRFDFVLNTKELIPFEEVFVTSISVSEGVHGNNWVISLLIIVKKNRKREKQYCWTGTYSTQTREGKRTGLMPKCLMR
ncbi:MAG TPA: hypothetical protein PLO44_02865 [Candidatus Paceibacterota bacterium]|nr:hypothetical protein [Candidatus Paceibacterota bacterium]